MKRFIPGSLVALLFIYLTSSCNKLDTTDLGSDLIPAVDNVNTFQTILEIETDNVLFNDTTRMFNQDHAVGIISDDPEFGRTEASIYFTMEPSTFRSYPFVNNQSVVIDSVVLSLAYEALYGDSNSIQQFEVREIEPNTSFRADTSYRLDAPAFPVIETVLGSKSVDFKTLNDTLFYAERGGDTVSSVRELRIKLDTAFARKFVSYDTTTAYKNDSIFKTFFKGFEVKINEAMSPSKAALAYFNLNDNNRSKLTFYCRVANNGKTDTIAPSFIFLNDPHANLVRRTPGGNYLAYLQNGQGNGDDKIYLQSTPGSYTTLKIKGLDTLAQTNRVIHLAEIVAEKIESQQDNIFPPPAVLFLDAINATGDTAFTIKHDFVPSQEFPGYDVSLLGGVLRNNKYIFNISRYVQGIVTAKDPIHTLRLYAPYSTQPYYMQPNGIMTNVQIYLLLNDPVASGRVVLAGGSALSDKKLRLRIIYSKI